MAQRTTSQEFKTSPRQTAGGFFYTGLGQGHATIAPCRCASCDNETRAYLERERAKLAERILAGNASTIAKSVPADDDQPPLCPRCDRRLTLRTASRDGSMFWGCPAWPDCKGRRPL